MSPEAQEQQLKCMSGICCLCSLLLTWRPSWGVFAACAACFKLDAHLPSVGTGTQSALAFKGIQSTLAFKGPQSAACFKLDAHLPPIGRGPQSAIAFKGIQSALAFWGTKSAACYKLDAHLPPIGRGPQSAIAFEGIQSALAFRGTQSAACFKLDAHLPPVGTGTQSALAGCFGLEIWLKTWRKSLLVLRHSDWDPWTSWRSGLCVCMCVYMCVSMRVVAPCQKHVACRTVGCSPQEVLCMYVYMCVCVWMCFSMRVVAQCQKQVACRFVGCSPQEVLCVYVYMCECVCLCLCVSMCVGLARTIYTRCIYGIFGREITVYTVIYGAYIRFWPTVYMCVWVCMCVLVCVCHGPTSELAGVPEHHERAAPVCAFAGRESELSVWIGTLKQRLFLLASVTGPKTTYSRHVVLLPFVPRYVRFALCRCVCVLW